MTADPRIVAAAWFAVIVIVGTGIGVVLADSPAVDVSSAVRRPTARPEYAPPVGESITRDGLVVVGKHVKHGTYRTAGGPRCTWIRYADLTGDATSILDRGAAPGRTTVDLVTGVAGFETHGCPEWVMVR